MADEVALLKMEQHLLNEKSELQRIICRLINEYGFKMLITSLTDEAARRCLCSYDPEAVTVFDVLRTVKEELDESRSF
jgi:hypothetical protein